MQTVVEEYVSCITQQIYGKIYSPGEVVPGASVLPTLTALLQTKRLKTQPRIVFTDDAQDIGSAQAVKKKTPAEKRAATIAAKKRKAEAL